MSKHEHDPAQSVLLLYSSRFGQSRKIAETIAETLTSAGLRVEVAELTDATRLQPERHCALGLVMSVRYGHFARAAFRLVKAHKTWLATVPTLLVTVSLTARKPEKRDPARHSYTRKFLARTGWQPSLVEVAAGALEYSRYNVVDRMCIRLIMWIMGGETDGVSTIEYTDWASIRAAARRWAKMPGMGFSPEHDSPQGNDTP